MGVKLKMVVNKTITLNSVDDFFANKTMAKAEIFYKDNELIIRCFLPTIEYTAYLSILFLDEVFVFPINNRKVFSEKI